MVIVAVLHRVEDYDVWKAGFDEYPPRGGGALFHRVNRMVGDPNNVAVVAGFESFDGAQAFISNPELSEAMKRSGVVGEPRIEFYEEAESVQY